MCVSDHMEFQNRVGRFFLFCSKFLHGDDRETMSERGNPWEFPKILEKVSGWGSEVKTRHDRVYNIFMPKYICRACRCISSVFSVNASCVVV